MFPGSKKREKVLKAGKPRRFSLPIAFVREKWILAGRWKKSESLETSGQTIAPGKELRVQ